MGFAFHVPPDITSGAFFRRDWERWLRGLRHRTSVRYTGDRIGGSNPSPLRHPVNLAAAAMRFRSIQLSSRAEGLTRSRRVAWRDVKVGRANST